MWLRCPYGANLANLSSWYSISDPNALVFLAIKQSELNAMCLFCLPETGRGLPQTPRLGKGSSLGLTSSVHPVQSPHRALITPALKSTLSRSQSPPLLSVPSGSSVSQSLAHLQTHVLTVRWGKPTWSSPIRQWKQSKAVSKWCWLFSRSQEPINLFS